MMQFYARTGLTGNFVMPTVKKDQFNDSLPLGSIFHSIILKGVTKAQSSTLRLKIDISFNSMTVEILVSLGCN